MKTFVLRIDSRTDQGYPIEVASLNEQSRELEEPFGSGHLADPPESPDLIRDFLLKEEGQSTRFGDIGESLFQWITGTDPGKKWRLEVDSAAEENPSNPVRTILEINDSDLKLVPWELLSHDSRKLFLWQNHPIVHGTVDFRVEAEPFAWPIRFLIVVGSDDQSVKAVDEVRIIRRTLSTYGRMVELNVLWKPETTDFFSELRNFRPHILHYIGHGVEHPVTKETVLEFRPDQSERWAWSAMQIINEFQNWRPRVVCLNACRSSYLSVQAHSWKLTDAFRKSGVPAVIGMLADIRGDAAAALSGPLYRHIVDGYSVDIAMTKARKAIFDVNYLIRDWSLARFEVSVLPENVLPMVPRHDNQARCDIHAIPEFISIRDFINRDKERRSLCFGMEPICEGASTRHLYVIRGESEVGKSALLRYCLEACVFRGWKIAMVDFKHGPTRKFLDVLRMIRDGDENTTSMLLRSDLNQIAFNRFNYEINHLEDRINNIPYPEFSDIYTPIVDEGNEWPEDAFNDAAYYLKLFREALSQNTGERPLLLALDHIQIEETHFNKILVPHLFGPIAQGLADSVYVILALSEADTAYDLGELVPETEAIRVNAFLRKDFKKFAEELCCLYQYPLTDKIKEGINTLGKLVPSRWKPGFLSVFREIDYS